MDTIEVDPPREGRPAQVWVGVPRDDTVGTTPAVRDGYILVHGRGQNGSLRIANQPLVPGTLRQALEDEGLADHQPLVLLTPGAQESAEALADDRDADVWAPDSPIWVSESSGAVFIGQANESGDGGFEPWQAGHLQKFAPDGTVTVDDQQPPLNVLTVAEVAADPGPWRKVGVGNSSGTGGQTLAGSAQLSIAEILTGFDEAPSSSLRDGKKGV